MSGLTPKQQRFVEEYLVDLNATQAFIRAGYAARGNAAEVNAARLLRNAQVAAAVQAQRAKLSERTARTIDDIMADIGRVRDSAMQSIPDPDTGAQVMVSYKDALKALELEGKRLGAFVERVENSGEQGLTIKVIHE